MPSHLNPLDWLLLLLLGYSTLRAALRGFFREAFALAGFLLGFPLACWYYRPAAAGLAGLLTSPAVAQFTAFLFILAASTVIASLLGRLFRRGARTAGLGFADRLGGALFGLLRGAALAVTLLTALVAFLPEAPWVRNSRIAPYLLQGAHAVSFAMPRELRDQLHEGTTRLKHSSFDWIKSGFPSHT